MSRENLRGVPVARCQANVLGAQTLLPFIPPRLARLVRKL